MRVLGQKTREGGGVKRPTPQPVMAKAEANTKTLK